MSDAAQPMRTQQALRAAHLYYLQDLTMDAIADELGRRAPRCRAC